MSGARSPGNTFVSRCGYSFDTSQVADVTFRDVSSVGCTVRTEQSPQAQRRIASGSWQVVGEQTFPPLL